MASLFYEVGGEPARVMLATTAYDSPDASYTFSIARSREALHERGLPTAYLLLSGNCHVDDARNKVVHEFLKSDCTDLVFLDADVSWAPEHLVKLCEYDCDVVGGVYPYRRESGKEGMPFKPLPETFKPENGLLEVAGLPTGFLRIRRSVLERMAKEVPSFHDKGKQDIPEIFRRTIDSRKGRMGGDIGFCQRWRDMGGKVYAAAELRLGHCGKQIVRDSLAAYLRRQIGLSLKHVADLIRDEQETDDDLEEARKTVFNPWGAEVDFLRIALLLTRKCDGPIIEAGSGLSTILMAAARPDLTVWCIEHDPMHSLKLDQMSRQAGVFNIKVIDTPIRDGWYDLSEDMDEIPAKFAFGIVDGPPRLLGDRMGFFSLLGERCSVIMADDADDWSYQEKLRMWAAERDMVVETETDRTAVLLPFDWR